MIFQVLLIFASVFLLSTSSNVVEYYEKLIIDASINAQTYKLPLDASQHKPVNQEANIEDFGIFDFVVIGAGSSGSVIAERLTANGQWSVLLLEAGDFGNNLTDIPGMAVLLGYSDFNWGYRTMPQTTACLGIIDQKCPYPRGKGVGGASLIHAHVYSRCTPTDYNKLAKLLHDPSWSYQEILPLFKKSENIIHSDLLAPLDLDYHGVDGPLTVEFHRCRNRLLDTFLEANQQMGYKLIDYNSNEEIGVSPYQLNTNFGRRADCGTSFIRPNLHRSNLKVSTNSFVTKILIDNKLAYGVEFVKNSITHRVKARKEVILSAGTIASPHLLMLSGIGPKAHLTQMGIETVQNLEVGSKLIDHPAYLGLHFRHNITEPSQSLSEMIKDFLSGLGPLAVTNQGLGFYQTPVENTPNYPDLEITPLTIPLTTAKSYHNFTEEMFNAVWGNTEGSTSLTFFIIGLHPKSFGTVRLNSNNPFDYPIIDPNYLSDANNDDIETLYQGIQIVLKLAKTDAYKGIDLQLASGIVPACKDKKYLSKDYWYCAIRYLGGNAAHPVGTCALGRNPREGAVVNAQFKVHGVKNLRVADCSVFPFALSGHTHAACVMVGEKASEIILKEYNV